MNGSSLAWLKAADLVAAQLAAPGATPAAVAAGRSMSPQAVSKAAWLARRYPEPVRAELGADVLSVLSAGHLEIAAAIPDPGRLELLRRAAREAMTVRQFRRL